MMNFQVLVADINIGYEEIVNIQVTMITTESIFMVWDLFSQVIIYILHTRKGCSSTDRINCTTPVHILNDADQNWLSPTAVIYIS
jgi:hypothetical protein